MALFTKRTAVIGPYIYGRGDLPSAGSMTLTFVSHPIYPYNPIGAGYQNLRSINTVPAQFVPRMVGFSGPGGYTAGQFYNPPLINSGNY